MQALQSLKTKYYFYSTWRRFRALWNDYQAVAGGNDLEAASEKLSEFLDDFKANYEQLVKEGYLDPKTLDRIFGDIGDILLELLEALFAGAGKNESENAAPAAGAAIVNKVLSVAELILHDEKYRALVQHSPQVLRRLVELLDTLKGTDNRRAVLRLIASLGTRLEAQLEIGRLEGFKKLALLLLEGDAALSAEIYNTLHALIDALSVNPPPQVQGEVHKLIKIAEQRAQETPRSPTTSKLSSVFSALGTALTQFTTKARDDEVFDELDEKEQGTDESAPKTEDTAEALVPSKEALVAAEFAFAERERFLAEDFALPALDAQRTAIQEQIQELMRAQGTLASLTASLSTHDELLETLCKLLLASPRNQLEFARLNGYDALVRLFEERSTLLTAGDDDGAFTARAMRLLCALVLDVRGEGLVGNVAALRALLCIACSGRVSLTVQRAALNVAHALLALNPLNVAAIAHLGDAAVPRLLGALDSARHETVTRSLQGLLVCIACLESAHSLRTLRLALVHAHAAASHAALECALAMVRELAARRVSAPLLSTDESLLAPLLALLESDSPALLVPTILVVGALCGVQTRLLGSVNEAVLTALRALNTHSHVEVASHALLVLTLLAAQISVALHRVHDSLLALDALLTGDALPSASRVLLCAALVHAARLLVQSHTPRHGHGGVAIKGTEEWLQRLVHALLAQLACADVLVREAAWAAYGALLPLIDALCAVSFTQRATPASLTPAASALVAAQVVSDARSLAPLLHVFAAGLGDASSAPRELSLLSPLLLSAVELVLAPHPVLLALPLPPPSRHETAFLPTDAQHAALTALIVPPLARASPPHSPLPLLSRAASLSSRALSRVHVRSVAAVSLVHAVSESLSVPLKRELATLLVRLARASEASLQRLRRGTALIGDVTRRLLKTRDEVLRSELLELLVELARYDLSAEELAQLLSLSADSALDVPQRVRLLHGVAQIADRETPPATWSFSGMSGHFRIAYVDRFPPSNVGYTFTCWIQLCLDDEYEDAPGEDGDGEARRSPSKRRGRAREKEARGEQGLVAWTQQQSDAPLWELYLKRAGPRRRVLCIQTRRGASPAETLTLDKVVFADDEWEPAADAEGDAAARVTWSRWRHLTLTHKKEELSVYLDGRFVQRVARVPDPRALLPDDSNALAGYVGRRAPTAHTGKTRSAPSQSHLRARLGPLYWLNGCWPPESVRKAHRAGPLASTLEPTELRPFLVLHPHLHAVSDDDGVTAREPTPSREAVMTGSIQDTALVPGVLAHVTRPLRSLAVAEGADALPRLLALIEDSAGHAHLVPVLAAALRALVHSVLECAPLQSALERLDGYARVQRALVRAVPVLGRVVDALDALLEWACQRVRVVRALETARDDVVCVLRAPLQILLDVLHAAAEHLAATPLPPTSPAPSLASSSSGIPAPAAVPGDDVSALGELVKRNMVLLSLLVGLNPHGVAATFLAPSGPLLVSAAPSPSASPSASPSSSFSSLPAPSSSLLETALSSSPLSSSLSSLSLSSLSVSASLGGPGAGVARCLFGDVLLLCQRLALVRVSWRALERVLQALLPLLDVNGARLLLAALLSALPPALAARAGASGDEDWERGKAALLRVLLREMAQQRRVVARFVALEFGADEGPAALHTALALLQSSHEEVRLGALQMLALLLHASPQHCALYMERHHGFHVVGLRLAPHPLSADLVHTLLGVALDLYRCHDRDDARTPELAADADEAGTDGADADGGAAVLVRPEAVHALLTLLPYARDERLRGAVLVEVERLLRVEENVERLWGRGSGEWLLALLEQALASDEHQRLVATLVRRLVLCELTHRAPSARLSALLASGHDAAVAYVLELLARHYREHPQLHVDSAPHVLAHLTLLWRASLVVPCGPAVPVAILDAIGQLLVHNSAPVRALVQRAGLLSVRAELVAHLLQVQRLEPLTTRHFVLHFDVAQVAHHDDFRACHGLTRLLLALHECDADDAPYRTRLVAALRTACTHHEQHALLVRDLLTQHAPPRDADALFQSLLHDSPDTFLTAYFDDSHSELRARIAAALAQQLQPYDARFKARRDSAHSEQTQRRERARSAASRSNAERWAACAAVEQRCRRLAALGGLTVRALHAACQDARDSTALPPTLM